MMILSSMSTETPTPIDSTQWLPAGNFTNSLRWNVDSWARKTVYLLGCVHNFRFRTSRTSEATVEKAIQSEWNELATIIRQHETCCPATCRPLSVVEQQPLPDIAYANASVAAAWQMYHTLVLIHAACAPGLMRGRQRLLFDASSTPCEQARLIVANSISNRYDVAWVNAVQLLTTAGYHLNGWSIRHRCATILQDIRQSTGWKTEENVSTLFEVWDREVPT